MRVSIKGLDKADVLAALYNAARPQGLGFMQYKAKPMKREEARELLRHHSYFDYLHGRVMKIDVGRDEIETGLFDRNNGEGAGELAIKELRAGRGVNSPDLQRAHREGLAAAAVEAHQEMKRPDTIRQDEDGFTSITLGLERVADTLGPAVESAVESAFGGSDDSSSDSGSFEGGGGDSGGGGSSDSW